MEVSEELKRLSEVLSVHPGLSQSMTYYQLAYSSDPSPHLDFSEMTQEKILSQSLYLKPDELQSTTLGHKVCMPFHVYVHFMYTCSTPWPRIVKSCSVVI